MFCLLIALLHFRFLLIFFSFFPLFHLLLLIPASKIFGSGSETNIQFVVFTFIALVDGYQCFGVTYCLHLQGRSQLRQCVAPKSLYPRTILQYGTNMYRHHRENLT
jgi:hypothetical protein